jgi:diguanylate cyclase (GGDEF)-like protein/PAS domain S-box-containing protein
VLAVCAVLVVATAIAISQTVSANLSDAAIQSAARTTTALVNGSVGPTVAQAFAGGPGAPDDATVNADLARLVGEGPLLRIKVWAPDGTVRFSDLPALRGQKFPVDDDLTDVLRGAVSTSIGGSEEPENVFERGLASQLLSVYLPIREPNGQIVAAFEVYQDAGPIEAAVAATSREVLLIVGALGLMLLGLLAAAFTGASRRIGRQNRRLREQAQVEAQLVDDLRRRDERFQSLVRNAADVQAILDAEGRLNYESPAVARVLGVDAEARAGTPVTDTVDREDAPRLAGALAELARTPGAEATLEYRAQHGDGTPRTIEAVVRNLLDDPAVAGLVLNYRDVTAQRNLEEALRRKAFHDPLTGLANRALFLERLEQALARGVRGGPRPAVLFLDLDDFKTVNDGLGHASGDRLLVEVGQRLATGMREGDTLARMGGDEFAVIVEAAGDAGTAIEVAQRLRARLSAPFRHAGKEVFVHASVGVAVATRADDRAGSLLRSADAAMYTAKTRGKDRVEVFAPAMHHAALGRLALKADLERALERQELAVAFQPIVALAEPRIVGAEALLRWHHPTRGDVAPPEFIALAEETGLIVPIGRWVLEQAVRTAASWPVDGTPTRVSVNVSARQLLEPDFVPSVAATLADAGLPAERVVLELTESILIAGAGSVTSTLAELRELGVRLAIDDFGTGFSSLSYLSRLPIDILKVDRAFVADLDTNRGPAVVEAVVRLAQSLGIRPVAEGIETVEQLEALRALRVPAGQGFLFSRAVGPTELAALVARPPAAWRSLEVPARAGSSRSGLLLPRAAAP